MPRLSLQQTNFTAGELSPRLYGRTDVDRYANAAKVLENAHPVIHGGAARRAGTRFVQETKTSSKKNRLVDFVFSRDLAYMLEFGDYYVRVYSPNGVYLGVEVVSPFSESMLGDIDYVQGSDTMFLFHPSIPQQRLRRFTNTVWDLSSVPYTVQPFDEQGLSPSVNLTLSALSGVITVTAASAVFLASDVGRNLSALAGIGPITGFTSTTVVTVTVTNPFLSTSLLSGSWNLDVSPQTTLTPSAVGPVGAAITLTLGASGWRAADVGKYVRVNTGIAKITSFTSDTIVSASVVTVLANTTAAPALSWSLEASVWSSANGFPRTGTLHEQRLWCAGSTKYPQTIWGSRTALFYDYTKGTADSDACVFTISSDEVNPISFLASNRNLLIHTFGAEMSMGGGNEKPITPTNVQIKPQTGYGSKNVRPLLIGKESIFVQRSGRKVRAMSYGFQIDGYQAPDLTILAEHITQSGIVAMAYQQEPDQLMWLALGDGTLISCTLDRDQQVNGWARHYTDGAVESVACIPNGTQDQVWITVRRTINGATKRYVEYLDNTFQPIYPAAVDPLAMPPIAQPITYGCTVDAGVVVDNAGGQTVFTGLGHLEGKSVDIIADGSPMPRQTVSAGQITLPRSSKRTLIGLHFKSTITLLTPEVGTGTGTAQGNSMSTRELTMRFYNTLGAQVFDGEGHEQDVPFRHFGTAVLDQPPPVYSGLVRIEMLGWERGKSELSIVQDQPLPMHLLSVVRKITVND
jgi:hypothetical protein